MFAKFHTVIKSSVSCGAASETMFPRGSALGSREGPLFSVCGGEAEGGGAWAIPTEFYGGNQGSWEETEGTWPSKRLCHSQENWEPLKIILLPLQLPLTTQLDLSHTCDRDGPHPDVHGTADMT